MRMRRDGRAELSFKCRNLRTRDTSSVFSNPRGSAWMLKERRPDVKKRALSGLGLPSRRRLVKKHKQPVTPGQRTCATQKEEWTTAKRQNNRSQKKGLRSRSKPQNNLRFTKGVNPNPMPRNLPRRGYQQFACFQPIR